MPIISQYYSTSNNQPDSSLGLPANLGGKSSLIEDTRPLPEHLYTTKVAKAGHYLIKTRQYCLSSFTAECRSLNDCTACRTQASQVSTRIGDQSGSGILKGTIDSLLKPDERFN